LALILALARSLKLHLNLKMARQCLLSQMALKSAREDDQRAQKTSRHTRRGRNIGSEANVTQAGGFVGAV